jgi:hypothetical protein
MSSRFEPAEHPRDRSIHAAGPVCAHLPDAAFGLSPALPSLSTSFGARTSSKITSGRNLWAREILHVSREHQRADLRFDRVQDGAILDHLTDRLNVGVKHTIVLEPRDL